MLEVKVFARPNSKQHARLTYCTENIQFKNLKQYKTYITKSIGNKQGRI